MAGSGVKIWASSDAPVGNAWVPVQCDANGVLQVDDPPGSKKKKDVRNGRIRS